MIPKDPAILLSFINMRLRDGGEDLEELCAAQDEDPEEIAKVLKSLGYRYDRDRNQFIAAP